MIGEAFNYLFYIKLMFLSTFIYTSKFHTNSSRFSISIQKYKRPIEIEERHLYLAFCMVSTFIKKGD